MAEKKEKKLLRCFIALELSREAINEIEKIQKLIKKKNLFYGKFTEPENLHLTLKFLGEISKEKVEEIRKKLGEIKMTEFEASPGELGLFSRRMFRILWIKLRGEGVYNLQKLIDQRLKGILEPEERFMGHITIARIKNVPDKKELLKYVRNMKIKPMKFQVKEFVLKKSELKEEGHVYSELGKYSLKS